MEGSVQWARLDAGGPCQGWSAPMMGNSWEAQLQTSRITGKRQPRLRIPAWHSFPRLELDS